MKTTIIPFIFGVALSGCQTFEETTELQRAWETIDAKRTVTDTAAPAVLAQTAEATPNAIAHEPQPSAKTDVRRVAHLAAARAIASGLLFREWQPRRIRLLDEEASQSNPACSHDIGLLVQYEHANDRLGADQETCWYERSSKEANLRFQAAYLAGIEGARLLPEPAQLPELDERDASRVKVQLCNTLLGQRQYKPENATTCEDAIANGTVPAEIDAKKFAATVREYDGARACATAIVRANRASVGALAAQIGSELRDSAIEQWKDDGNPLPDTFLFTLPAQLQEFRKSRKHALKMPARREARGLPAYCVAAK